MNNNYDNTREIKESLKYNIETPLDYRHSPDSIWFQLHGMELMTAFKEILTGLEKWGIKCSYNYTDHFECNLISLWDGTFKCLPRVLRQAVKWVTTGVGLKTFIRKFQERKINDIFQEVCKKHPTLVNELVKGVSFYELINSGEVSGKKIVYKYLGANYWEIVKNEK